MVIDGLLLGYASTLYVFCIPTLFLRLLFYPLVARSGGFLNTFGRLWLLANPIALGLSALECCVIGPMQNGACISPLPSLYFSPCFVSADRRWPFFCAHMSLRFAWRCACIAFCVGRFCTCTHAVGRWVCLSSPNPVLSVLFFFFLASLSSSSLSLFFFSASASDKRLNAFVLDRIARRDTHNVWRGGAWPRTWGALGFVL